MTVITNKYTLGLIVTALFAAFIYIGYLEFKPGGSIAVMEMETSDIGLYETLQTGELEHSNNYFIEYKLERERTRSRQIELLQQVVEDPNSVADTRQQAQQKLLQIISFLEQELQLEHLITAKGFLDSVAFIQPQSVTVVIDQESFAESEIVKIADLVIQVTKQEPGNIYIIPKEQSR